LNKTLLEKAYNNIFREENFYNIFGDEENHNQYYIQTGYKELDYFLSECTKGSLITIGARPSMGKTVFSMNLLEQLLIQGKKCLYFSYNIPVESFLRRLIIQQAELSRIRTTIKDFSDEDIQKLSNAKNTIEKWNLHICSEALTDAGSVDNLIKKIKPDYVFIDNIQDIWIEKLTIRHFARMLKKLIKDKKLNSEEVDPVHKILDSLPISWESNVSHRTKDISIDKINEFIDEIDRLQLWNYYDPLQEIRMDNIIMDYIAKYLKIIAKKHETVIFVNSQLKRTVESRKSKLPKLRDLDAPQSLAKASDIVLMLYRKEYYKNSQYHLPLFPFCKTVIIIGKFC